MLDVGGDTVVVGRDQPGSLKRARREDIKPERMPEPARPRRAPPPPKPVNTDPTKLHCTESPHGLCALQRQASPPRRQEMAEGQLSICGEWLTGRSAPKRGEPTCPRCRILLKLEGR